MRRWPIEVTGQQGNRGAEGVPLAFPFVLSGQWAVDPLRFVWLEAQSCGLTQRLLQPPGGAERRAAGQPRVSCASLR